MTAQPCHTYPHPNSNHPNISLHNRRNLPSRTGHYLKTPDATKPQPPRLSITQHGPPEDTITAESNRAQTELDIPELNRLSATHDRDMLQRTPMMRVAPCLFIEQDCVQ